MSKDRKLFEEFGLEDLTEEHSDSRAGAIVLAVFLFAMWAALAWTTAEFFAAFGSQLGQRFGTLASLFAAAFGVLTIDVAYSAWLYAGKSQADTAAQRVSAIGTAVVLFLISLAVTATYMMLTGSLREGVIDAQMDTTLRVAGIAILAASTVVNGIGLMLWAVLGHSWREAAAYAKMRAALYTEKSLLDEQRAQLIASANREHLRGLLPELTQQRGVAVGTSYLQRSQLMTGGAAGAPDDGWRPYAVQSSGTEQQHVEPPAQQPVRDNSGGQFHTTLTTDEFGTEPISSNLSRDEFNQVMRLAEDAKRRGELANFTNGRTNGR